MRWEGHGRMPHAPRGRARRVPAGRVGAVGRERDRLPGPAAVGRRLQRQDVRLRFGVPPQRELSRESTVWPPPPKCRSNRVPGGAGVAAHPCTSLVELEAETVFVPGEGRVQVGEHQLDRGGRQMRALPYAPPLSSVRPRRRGPTPTRSTGVAGHRRRVGGRPVVGAASAASRPEGGEGEAAAQRQGSLPVDVAQPPARLRCFCRRGAPSQSPQVLVNRIPVARGRWPRI